MRVGILSQYYPRDGRSAGAALGARGAEILASAEAVSSRTRGDASRSAAARGAKVSSTTQEVE
jgi:hypothetical protein